MLMIFTQETSWLIRGHWGGFKTLENLVTGSYAGHSVGNDIIAIPPWDEWWESELKKDESNPHIALLPLHPDMRTKFNNTAAWEYAKCLLHKPYGYHNMIFSWIDTISGNYLPPLDAHSRKCEQRWLRKGQKNYSNLNEALNKRLGTQGLELPGIIVEAEKRGTSFDKLLTIPEQDDWVYTDGRSTSCAAFILEIYKAAGLFHPIASSIRVTDDDKYTTILLCLHPRLLREQHEPPAGTVQQR
ncbi:unnamed protein product [Musa textilis]